VACKPEVAYSGGINGSMMNQLQKTQIGKNRKYRVEINFLLKFLLQTCCYY
jgi:hypothetical protein